MTTHALRVALLFLVVSPLLTSISLAADHPAPALVVEPNEDLFYQEQYARILAITQKLWPQVYEEVLESDIFSKGFGLKSDYKPQWPIKLAIKVIPRDTLEVSIGGLNDWEWVDKRWVPNITLNIAAYMQYGTQDYNQTLAHELAHLFLADLAGPDKISSIPQWMNEGMAQSVTSQGKIGVKNLQDRLKASQQRPLLCDLNGPIDSFSHGENNTGCYPQFYLAFKKLEGFGGPPTFAKIVEGLKNGMTIENAFLSATGQDYGAFRRSVDVYTTDVLARRQTIP